MCNYVLVSQCLSRPLLGHNHHGSYLAATASQAQHYLVSTPLKLKTLCASQSTLLTLNNLVFNINEFNTISIPHYFNSTTLHFNKFSSTISHLTPLTFNNLTFNNHTFNNIILKFNKHPLHSTTSLSTISLSTISLSTISCSSCKEKFFLFLFLGQLFCRTTQSCVIGA